AGIHPLIGHRLATRTLYIIYEIATEGDGMRATTILVLTGISDVDLSLPVFTIEAQVVGGTEIDSEHVRGNAGIVGYRRIARRGTQAGRITGGGYIRY